MRDVRMWWDVNARAGSERAAEDDVRIPRVAARREGVKGASVSVRHRARGGDVRQWET